MLYQTTRTEVVRTTEGAATVDLACQTDALSKLDRCATGPRQDANVAEQSRESSNEKQVQNT